MSELELLFTAQLDGSTVPDYVREHRFCGRRFRFDFAWPDSKFAVEIQGGTWTKGGHTTGRGIQADYDKLYYALLHSWRVLPVTGDDVRKGRALHRVERIFGIR